jgi:glyoxylase-like metal-dependent hydrolase (beta-lactamase superfamily II)
MQLGDFSLTVVNGGNFRLDGGAMHGVVPKTIWSHLVSCDDKNRVAYATNCLLIEGRGRRILVETGNGDKFPPKWKEIYSVDHEQSIGKQLRALGVPPESIDLVVLTHLHFDHAGGATEFVRGVPRPVFARARHVVQRGEHEAALHPHERNRASYLAENFVPLAEGHLLDLVDGETEIAPGLRVLPTPGHTPGHQSVLLDTGAGQVLFFGDVVPTALHVRLPFIMAYDLDVTATLQSKKALYARAIAEKWTVVWGHELVHAAGGVLGYDDKGEVVVTRYVDLAPTSRS